MIIKLSTTLCWPIQRQIPSAWREAGIEVAINRKVEHCDAWVVYQGMARPDKTIVPKDRVFFFGYEPPGLHQYNRRFLSQFAAVVTCQDVNHSNLIRRHQSQPWLAGVKRSATDNVHKANHFRFSHDDFVSMQPPLKTKRLSAVCSTKQMVAGHSNRLHLVESVRTRLGALLDLFGYGFLPLEDKWDALIDHHYHLVLENSLVAHYWTEKLADAYLAWCMPIVWGCPNLADYFPADSFILLEANDPDTAAAKVAAAASSLPTAKQFAAVCEARRMVLEEYNLFSEIRRMVDQTPSEAPRKVRLKDERLFLPGNLLRPIIRAITDRIRYD